MKINKLFSILLVLVLSLALAACGSGAETPEADAEAAQEAETTEGVAEAAQLEDKVVIYSTHSEAMLELVASEFEKETGVAVEFINLKGELADRVRAEKENPQSDVMFGGASSVFMELQDEDLFEAYEPTWGSKCDGLYKDAENYWYGTIQTPVMIFYNSEVISEENAPKDWTDLASDEYKDQLVFRNALSSSARATYSSLLQQFEMAGDLDGGWGYIQKLDANTKQYYSSGSLMFQAIGRQEAGISFATLNSIIDNKVNNKIPLEVVNAESGSPIITDGIALVKNGKNPNAAKAFIDFAGSAKIQGMLATEFNRMPTNPDAIAMSPQWMGEIEISPMDVDWADLAKKQSEWMQKWDAEFKDNAKDPK
ncbi:MAG TPA: extracellular solute-binding protein [Clostridia bacterium]|nr:extracellular solute-binding protein [Clostridia bacterium]